MSPANIQIGAAILGPDAPIVFDGDDRWRRRDFVGRMSDADAKYLIDNIRTRRPSIVNLYICGEPTWPALVISVDGQAIAAPGVWYVRVAVMHAKPPVRAMVGA